MKTNTLLHLVLSLVLCLSGCTFVWTDKIFMVDMLKDRDIDTISLISEPNYVEVIAEKYKSHQNPEAIKAAGTAGGNVVGAAAKAAATRAVWLSR